MKSIGVVYIIKTENSGDVYIGSTADPLKERMSSHYSPHNKTTSRIVIDQGKSSYHILRTVFYREYLINADLEQDQKSYLRQIEQYYHDIYRANIVNGNKAFLTEEEKKNYNSTYRKKNPEKVKFYDTNSKPCLCGGKFKMNRPKDHLNTLMHKNYVSKGNNLIKFHSQYKDELFWNKNKRKMDIPLDGVVYIENLFMPKNKKGNLDHQDFKSELFCKSIEMQNRISDNFFIENGGKFTL